MTHLRKGSTYDDGSSGCCDVARKSAHYALPRHVLFDLCNKKLTTLSRWKVLGSSEELAAVIYAERGL